MMECCENPSHLCQFPTELLLFIFKFLSVKTLVSCRRVCRRWKEIVENITYDDSLWLQHCRKDFETTFEDAKKKSISCVYWYDVYRSLSLWARLSDAEESRDEFCHSSNYVDQIEDSYILYNGIAAVHKRCSVSYYDISTLEVTKRSPINGQFSKFVEFDEVLIVLGEHSHLHIIWRKSDDKSVFSLANSEQVIHRSVKHFRTFGRHLYFVNIDNEIFYCNLDEKMTVTQLPRNHDETVMTISLYQGELHTLTAERNVYKFVNGQFVLLFDLEDVKDNLFNCLWQYEFIEHISWHQFYYWMAHFRLNQPQSPLGYISVVKVYGNVFFIGCKLGLLLIYYKPFTPGGMLDLFNHEPVKQYNFTERQDIPVLSLQPIISIDVIEIKNGHKVLVGMPKKLIILMFEHSFKVMTCKAVIPYVPPGPLVV